MDGVLNKLRNLDAYPKINEDFYSRTLSGGVITLVSSFAILFLFLSEFRLYLHTVNETKLLVDTSRGETLRINFDVTFPAIRCSLLSLDAADISGEQHLDIVFKKRIDAHGNLIEAKQDGIGAPKRYVRIEAVVVVCGSSLMTIEEVDLQGLSLLELVVTANVCWLTTMPKVQWQQQLLVGSNGALVILMGELSLAFGWHEVLKLMMGLVGCRGLLQGWHTVDNRSDDDCCNSCEEVQEAYRKRGWAMTNSDLIDQCKREGFFQKIKDEDGEGCNIEGSLEVNKVAGNFHFVPGKSLHLSNMHGLLALQKDSYNISHKINRLAFGDYFPGVVNPLDGVQWMQETPNGMYQYFLKVVPTIYTNVRGRSVYSNQYSVTEHFKSFENAHSQSLPGVFFFYDLSPIKTVPFFTRCGLRMKDLSRTKRMCRSDKGASSSAMME
ncbi:hypothetical protein FEM48_Zijuj09G0145300 [Ziziphus jujuba var. spinosa]|uniref:Endoplasmic reticulum-Golgi intermediate compartment protein 3-like n=1 Tax=Ziziphus jujuba var. spinosa TaxID=714518 RepID=A0A978UTJ0_ZIZJJ|nr:hypothetical protein FEM48_Zijuj09G0145300 [Ziziphus jujuba var. spinosa]